MEKLTKEIYIKHAKRVYAILNEKSPLVKYLTKKDFASIVEQQLNVLSALENKFKKEKVDEKYKASSLVKTYNKFANAKFNVDSKFKLNDNEEYIDSMNYLITYCNNIFKVNLDDLLEGKQVNVVTPSTPFKQQADVEDKPNAGAAFGAMGMGMGDFMNPRQNPLIMSQASAMLQKEMSNGTFYRYKTKPASIPKVKIVALVLSILACLSLVLMAIFAFVATNLQVYWTRAAEEGVLGSFMDGIFYLLFAGIGVFDLVVFSKSIKTKNENDKYFFPWQILLIFIIGSLMAVLFSINTIFHIGFNVEEPEGTSAFISYQGLQIMWYITIAFIVLMVIPTIIGGVKNPKVDFDAVDKRINQIIDQLTAGYGFSQRVQPQQSADVQKPVDVKKTDEKKDDEKKTSSSKSKKSKK